METFDGKIDIGKLELMFRNSPNKVRNMAMHYLNDAAFAYRAAVIDVMKTHKKVRDARFVQSKVLVQKTIMGKPNEMKATAGSVKGDRFSGWAEDYGAHPTGHGNRLLGTNARGGNMDAKAQPKNRLMSGIDMPVSKDYDSITGSAGQRVMAMISMIARDPTLAADSKGLFIINSGALFGHGAYRIKPGALAKIKSSTRKGKGHAFNWYTYAPAITRVQKFVQTAKFKKIDWVKIALREAHGSIEETLAQCYKQYVFNALKQ